MSNTKLPISHSKLLSLLNQYYGFPATDLTVELIHGELDLNLKVTVSQTAFTDEQSSDTDAHKTYYLLKISRPDEDLQYLDYQEKLLKHLAQHSDLLTPEIITTISGDGKGMLLDDKGRSRHFRLLSWLPGRLFYSVNPQSSQLLFKLGHQAGSITRVLTGFTHPFADEYLEWDIAHSAWTQDYLDLFNSEKQAMLVHGQKQFARVYDLYKNLRKSIVHNDVNDHNILVADTRINPDIIGLIDYGDARKTQLINDLAITCAYAMMGHVDPVSAILPLINGYHQAYPLHEHEIECLLALIIMRLIITVTKSAINKAKAPDNAYLVISEKPAWELLEKLSSLDNELVTYRFRAACGFDAHPHEADFLVWAKNHTFQLSELFPSIAVNDIVPLDLSVGSRWTGNHAEIDDQDLVQFKLTQLQRQHPKKIIAGGYLEARSLYLTADYEQIGNQGRENRTVHLGVDFWLPDQTPVHALLDAEVVVATDNAGDKQYGGLLILKHRINNELAFYTLYGHLSVASIAHHSQGDRIHAGEQIACLGLPVENGNWASHLHFQLMLSMLDYYDDFAGVALHQQKDVWSSICPDPNHLFKLASLEPVSECTQQELIRQRQEVLGKGMSLHYDEPITIVRGVGAYLVDDNGDKYLDTVNNVAHVGHEHPDVVKVGQQQMAVLNTNTRYLHASITQCAETLLATLPSELAVVHFVNSGSEANELAIRMLKTVTGYKDILASEVGYHGNTNAAVDVSSYKFSGKGGFSQPENTHIFPLPDTFRGKYRDADAATHYSQEVQQLITAIQAKGSGVAGLILEPIISCGGQVVPPQGWVKSAYSLIRQAGGLCISDEVQTGCGRIGKHFWGFQLHDVIPDIVTIGKPLGNGHPVAAVVCTQEVADAFANGMEYFNTFGGNPVSCAIANEVLTVVQREGLQNNAQDCGEFLKNHLNILASEFPIIGDVRGEGLFLGIELVSSTKQPLALQASYLTERMKAHKILMSTDGFDHNVLKIKPPLVFSRENALELITTMRKILSEDFMQISQ